MHPIVYLIVEIINIFEFVVFAWVILTLLIQFKIVNAYQPFVRTVMYYLDRLIEPVLRPIRNMLPRMGGLDLSPIILILGLHFIRYTLVYYF